MLTIQDEDIPLGISMVYRTGETLLVASANEKAEIPVFQAEFIGEFLPPIAANLHYRIRELFGLVPEQPC